jgi:hypothetical protein
MAIVHHQDVKIVFWREWHTRSSPGALPLPTNQVPVFLPKIYALATYFKCKCEVKIDTILTVRGTYNERAPDFRIACKINYMNPGLPLGAQAAGLC